MHIKFLSISYLPYNNCFYENGQNSNLAENGLSKHNLTEGDVHEIRNAKYVNL